MKMLFSLMVGVSLFLSPLVVHAGAVKVTFTPPTNAEWFTDVLVSETSGDYSQSYGQRSEAGADSLIIGDIKANTDYFFVAYRLVPDTWEKSSDSEEYAFTTPEKMPPEIHSLPPIEVGNVILEISMEVVEN